MNNIIKPLWDKHSESMANLVTLLDEFNAGITDTRTQKAFKKIVECFGQAVAQHNEIDKLIDPIAPITVKLPFEGEEFSKAWEFYKESLVEKHGFALTSRQEQIRLNRLKKMADSNQPRAIAMMDFFIDNGYKTIFKPTEKQLTGDEPTKVEEHQSTIDLSKKGKLD